ncbi:3' terminal RNA ribose 2'-O-methyltransferase Hen1 [Neobacillus sp. CF12]|uniref:3' terminal RNA ribose 2'-O-methyltransferase Hen1 n=1 Tax=Neobacillus sp. CF12 TaxID=3055864 RepID=UPI0025A24411|nr:3' terminal RNA ribose 2'-O-methyltransferase Hen1 [Neobacillus sp. CF12]MDM5331655.1 3' terminal RNA ribose 2'-O-methyltransferase Hen1 [Neobacillus sp. CF12]
MQLSLTVSGPGADVVSYLIAKNPNNPYERDEKGFKVRLVYPSFTKEEVQFVIYVKPDPIDLVRNSSDLFDITHYINDREFAVSSLFITAIRKALGTALNGKPDEAYLQWVDHPFEMKLAFGPVATDLQDQELFELFEPMGYKVEVERGDSTIRKKRSARFVTLTGIQTVQNALKHVSILIPVIDNYKHYFLDEREVEKLDRYGEGWLEVHPLKQMIVKRALRFNALIFQSKFYEKKQQNRNQDDSPRIRLNDLRYEAILNLIRSLPHKESIVDLGAGEGRLSVQVGFVEGIKEILSIEPSNKSRIRAIERFEQVNAKEGYVQPQSLPGSLYYFDSRLQNKDVIVLCEVIEHIDENRLPKIFETILNDYRPKTLIVTTPNQEYNVLYEMDEEMRHDDHRFEWTRAQFAQNVDAWSQMYPYQVSLQGIGEEHPSYGHPTQMAIFRREEEK